METLAYITILIGFPLMPVIMIVGHQLGEQSRQRKANPTRSL